MKVLKALLLTILIFNFSSCIDFTATNSDILDPGQFTTPADDADVNDRIVDSKNPLVKIETNYGDIVLELFEDKAPVTVENFLQYVDDGYYTKTLFHRVRDNFMIQGGGYTYDLKEKEKRDPVKNEASNGLQNKIFTVAMARTDDPNSAQSQFFINVRNNPALDFKTFSKSGIGYCVFGKVVSGFETVDKIASVKCRASDLNSGEESFPVKPVKIFSITRVKSKI